MAPSNDASFKDFSTRCDTSDTPGISAQAAGRCSPSSSHGRPDNESLASGRATRVACSHRRSRAPDDAAECRKLAGRSVNRIFTIFLLASLFIIGEAKAACKVDSPTSQDCTYILSWDWERGDGGPADGFIVQQMVDDNGEWYDIYDPLPWRAGAQREVAQ
jgi:hypothetical protein